MKSRTVTVERTILAPPQVVFDWLSTVTNYTASPLVLAAKLLTPGHAAPYGEGARRAVTSALSWFEEEITGYDPPHSFDYRIRRSVPSIRHDHGRVEFYPHRDGTTVVWASTSAVTAPVLGAALTAAAAPLIARTFAGLLAAANRALTTELPEARRQHPTKRT